MWIESIRVMDFLGERGILPLKERYGAAYYEDTIKLQNLLTSYTIRYGCFRNGYH